MDDVARENANRIGLFGPWLWLPSEVVVVYSKKRGLDGLS